MLKLRNESSREAPSGSGSASNSYRAGFGQRRTWSQDKDTYRDTYDDYVHFDREAWEKKRRISFSLSFALCSFAAFLWWWRRDATPRQLTASQL